MSYVCVFAEQRAHAVPLLVCVPAAGKVGGASKFGLQHELVRQRPRKAKVDEHDVRCRQRHPVLCTVHIHAEVACGSTHSKIANCKALKLTT